MAVAAEDRMPREPHPGEPCQVWSESATSPDYWGRFTVTEHCKCGRVLGTCTDSVL
jgi:hypothetical protein